MIRWHFHKKNVSPESLTFIGDIYFSIIHGLVICKFAGMESCFTSLEIEVNACNFFRMDEVELKYNSTESSNEVHYFLEKKENDFCDSIFEIHPKNDNVQISEPKTFNISGQEQTNRKINNKNHIENRMQISNFFSRKNENSILCNFQEVPAKTPFELIFRITYEYFSNENNSIKFFLPCSDHFSLKIFNGSDNKIMFANFLNNTIKFDRDCEILSIEKKCEISTNSNTIFQKQKKYEDLILFYDKEFDNFSSFIFGDQNIYRFNNLTYSDINSNVLSKSENRFPINEYILLSDCSGSVLGKTMTILKKVTSSIINKLPQNGFFNVLRFGYTFQSLFEESVEITKFNIDYALRKVGEMRADLGKTNLVDPLLYSMKNNKNMTQKYHKIIILITDGKKDDLTEKSKIFKIIKNMAQNGNQIFTIGIGCTASKQNLIEISELGNGKSAFINKLTDVEFTADQIIKEILSTKWLSNILIKTSRKSEKYLNSSDSSLYLPDKLFERKINYFITKEKTQNRIAKISNSGVNSDIDDSTFSGFDESGNEKHFSIKHNFFISQFPIHNFFNFFEQKVRSRNHIDLNDFQKDIQVKNFVQKPSKFTKENRHYHSFSVKVRI
ncbi:hypothetical protein TRFO_03772 [Tritrichomonas foetus]|uniref:VWFA domain-containing protein n=1 Tax=Tritrichomonas foetus TaxID=1144522 RepID=A0A1J4KLW9_9EUKA|nr:hypothetical protein TRFO_03772 [Tritrichomonas foetus]|eukprot:OHT12130.1 hypothetical protein TRFO_03772 [Tritrichomonas foetus]